jgi:hypothetical protein
MEIRGIHGSVHENDWMNAQICDRIEDAICFRLPMVIEWRARKMWL